jgi:hypothetical protein
MDIDLLVKVSNQPEDTIQVFREVLAVEVVADGLVFDPDSFRADHITEDAEYDGVRVLKDFYDIWLLSRQHAFEQEMFESSVEERAGRWIVGKEWPNSSEYATSCVVATAGVLS